MFFDPFQKPFENYAIEFLLYTFASNLNEWGPNQVPGDYFYER